MTERQNMDGAVRVRPLRSVFWRALAATAAFLLPVGAVLYFLTIPDGPWVVVAITQAVASVLFAIASYMFFRAGIWVSADGITERGFLGGQRHLPISELKSVMIIDTFHGGGAETLPQLFVCDADQRQVVRMRGQYWSRSDMRLVRDTLDLPFTEITESISRRELLARYPGLLYSFERHPIIVAAVFSALVIAGGVVLFAVLALLGIPAASTD